MKKYRRQMLPLWIKCFCWMFMVIGILTLLIMLVVSINSDNMKPALSIYGIDYQYNNLSAILIFITFIFNGVVAYMLWFGKKTAIKISFINIVWNFSLCAISMFYSYYNNSDFKIRLELILIILFYISIKKIKQSWENTQTFNNEELL